MQQLVIGSSEDSDAFKGISAGSKVYKDTIRRLGEQLSSQDVGRYSYNGVQDTWCGTASGQTLLTNDIVYLLGASSYTSYDASNINDVNIFQTSIHGDGTVAHLTKTDSTTLRSPTKS